MKHVILLMAVVVVVGCASTPYTPGKPYTNTLGMKFVPVPGTEVQFCIWETRVKDYAAYAAASAGVDANWKTPFPSFKQTGTHPVVRVSWNDAQEFCEWLTKKELAEGKIKAGQRYRLPTDTEWSVAVGLGKETGKTPKQKQVGIKGIYPWGKGWPPLYGAGNYWKSLKVDNFVFTSPVGSFAANKHGIRDMGGNASEWCEDWFDPEAKEYRVNRGMSWFLYNRYALLSSARNNQARENSRGNDIGFRCVLTNGQ